MELINSGRTNMAQKIFINCIVSSGYRKNDIGIKLSSNGGSLKTRKKILIKSLLYKGNLKNGEKFYH